MGNKTPKRPAYDVVLGERKIVMVELKPSEVRKAMQLAGVTKNAAVQEFDTALEGLRLAIREVDDQHVSYDDLTGTGWDGFFSTKETLALTTVWKKLHIPTEAEMEAVSGNLTARSVGTGAE